MTVFCFWTALMISRDGDAELGQGVGLHPDADRILARAEDRDPGDAGHAQELVVQIDVGIIGEESCVVGALRGVEGEVSSAVANLDFWTVTP